MTPTADATLWPRYYMACFIIPKRCEGQQCGSLADEKLSTDRAASTSSPKRRSNVCHAAYDWTENAA
ncbi:hypothetical protein PC118_g145 [Phytophthora cactorum]|uniref:Uncharacterized protein n=1 Tax=Phytophthora cactorum TaxID=29920 RepID=A0A8T1GS41_9STRA|nr:hypothetical protein PC114_g844 [Phytophthora cactorum]KAG3000600.1 hypothetical protein PC118_g145 [Phytophthora cactorum]